jgi:biopolymer transport protein ExbB
MDVTMLINKGGPVMWILLGYSIVAVAIVVERLIYFYLLPKVSGEVDALHVS